MRSTADQQLFKAMSNRTRARPEQIYSKLSTHLSQLQGQISQFNKVEEALGGRINRLISRPSTREFRLKTMTEPKYQNLLLDCELLKGEKSPAKNGKQNRKFSTKSGKQFKSNVMGSSLTSFIGFKSGAVSRLAQSRGMGIFNSKIKNKTDLQSTLLYTAAPPEPPFVPRHPQREINISVTQSVVLPNKSEANVQSRRKSKNMRVLIQEKQRILECEWAKTERNRGKVSSCLGEGEFERLQRGVLIRTRAANVIEKVKRSRPITANSQEC